MSGPSGARGIPPPRTWSRAELVLAALLLALAGAAWWLTSSIAMPGMQTGILTGPPAGAGEAMAGMGATAAGLGFFLLTWTVMMAAMMLPGITPFTVGISRLMAARAGGGTPSALTVGYLLVWASAGVLGYLVVEAFDLVAGRGEVATRTGAVVLIVAGAYQFTPFKQWCLVRCRSPFALLVRYSGAATRSRVGALLVGVRHGGYCFGCCWALMAVLLAAGVMSLVWMALAAAVITVEKVLPRGRLVSHGFGVLLLGLGAVLLVAP